MALFRKKQSPEEVEARRQESMRALDAQTMNALVDASADLERELDVDHFFADLDEQGARTVAERVASRAAVTVFSPGEAGVRWAEPLGASVVDMQESKTWGVQARQTMLVGAVSIAASRAEFEALAAEAGGTYDGWGAPIN